MYIDRLDFQICIIFEDVVDSRIVFWMNTDNIDTQFLVQAICYNIKPLIIWIVCNVLEIFQF